MFYLVLKAIKCHMEVSDTVASSKAAEYTSIMDWIGCGNVHNMEAHFECSTSLVPSDLQPNLTGWYNPLMPGKPASPETETMYNNLCMPLSYLSFPSKSCTTLSTRCGMYTKGASLISPPPDRSGKENGAISPFRFSPTFWNVAHPFLASQRDSRRFEPPATPVS